MNAIDSATACGVEGCPRRRWARGYCKNHYRRLRAYGDPLGGPGKGGKRQEPIGRFLDKIEVVFVPGVERALGPCWVWTHAALNIYGYGSFWIDGTTTQAHLFAYRTLVGPVPERCELDHLCRQRSCCNPDHLEPVSQYVNNMRSTSPSALNARKTHCPYGHDYAEFGVIYRGFRYCAGCAPTVRALADALTA